MTTKNSPLLVLKAQAAKIAAVIKAAAANPFPGKDTIKAGVVMDDKMVVLEIPWVTAQETTEAALAEYVLDRMLEKRDTVH